MRIRNSFWAMLGREVFESHDVVFYKVRSAMLAALAQHGAREHLVLHSDIANARDLSELWYARPRLLQAIASTHSEATAEQAMQEITSMFKGHFADAIKTRFGP
jgi:hypothetical protein